jgi:hypothetical protein
MGQSTPCPFNCRGYWTGQSKWHVLQMTFLTFMSAPLLPKGWNLSCIHREEVFYCIKVWFSMGRRKCEFLFVTGYIERRGRRNLTMRKVLELISGVFQIFTYFKIYFSQNLYCYLILKSASHHPHTLPNHSGSRPWEDTFPLVKCRFWKSENNFPWILQGVLSG